jgi:hypothetical protein
VSRRRKKAGKTRPKRPPQEITNNTVYFKDSEIDLGDNVIDTEIDLDNVKSKIIKECLKQYRLFYFKEESQKCYYSFLDNRAFFFTI